MIKKIVFFILIGLATFFVASSNSYASTANLNNGTPDQKMEIRVLRNGNVATIDHFTHNQITDALVEYVIMEDGEKIARLEKFDVQYNKFNLQYGVIAIRVHQLKILKDNVKYTFGVTGIYQIGNFDDVKRKGIAEIRTVHVETVVTDLLVNMSQVSGKHKYYEFYFNFDKEHDQVKAVDVAYVMNRFFLGIKTSSTNVEETIKTQNNVIHGYVHYRPYPTSPILFRESTVNYMGLEKNKNTSIDANYIVRVSPKEQFFGDSYKIENFAIIRISYYLDGEFIVDDVINDPWTPDEPVEGLDWLLAFINKLKDALASLGSLWDSSGSVFIKILIGIGVLIAVWVLKQFISVFKFIGGSIKSIFTGLIKVFKFIFSLPGKFINLLKFLFVPKKKGRRYR